MTRTPESHDPNRPPIPGGAGVDDPQHNPGVETLDRPGQRRATFRVELESLDRGIKHMHFVRADSMEEALFTAREAHRPSDGQCSDLSRYRAVEASEENAFTEARLQRNARRRYINTLVETGLTVLGQGAPAPSGEAFFDVFCDFFTRAVVQPGEHPFPSDDSGHDRLLTSHDAAVVMAQLLAAHLVHHGLKVTPIRPD
ncbi:hypothetical protein ACFW2K_36255 [Streptomyces nigra]|uniref:hypothetical protein n=1 Tax=Streptomyces nigra TaxID=1827580 RepID=UPI00367E8682